jgi:hypothetical protein
MGIVPGVRVLIPIALDLRLVSACIANSKAFSFANLPGIMLK